MLQELVQKYKIGNRSATIHKAQLRIEDYTDM